MGFVLRDVHLGVGDAARPRSCSEAVNFNAEGRHNHRCALAILLLRRQGQIKRHAELFSQWLFTNVGLALQSSHLIGHIERRLIAMAKERFADKVQNIKNGADGPVKHGEPMFLYAALG